MGLGSVACRALLGEVQGTSIQPNYIYIYICTYTYIRVYLYYIERTSTIIIGVK